jgi:hypothetical protein
VQLASVSDLRQYLGLTATTDDAMLGLILDAVSRRAEAYCDRSFALQNHTCVTDGRGGQVLLLPEQPVVSVTSVMVDTTLIPQSTGVTVPGWMLTDNRLVLRGYAFARGLVNVSVAYRAGYTTPPADLAFAAFETAASWYRRKGRIDEVSKSIQGETITFATGEIPAVARAILDVYKRPWPR